MTDAEELDDFEDDEPLIAPRKWHWAMLPAMVFNLLSNISQSWKQFFDEVSGAFFAHSTYKAQERQRKEEEKRFRESVDATLNKL